MEISIEHWCKNFIKSPSGYPTLRTELPYCNANDKYGNRCSDNLHQYAESFLLFCVVLILAYESLPLPSVFRTAPSKLNTFWKVKGTVMQIEKDLINDGLRVSKIS